jgi:FtsP/CotA-like multicopper oxidase with cupredoxin domain
MQFHIHVNPFMILSQKSHWDDNPDLQLFISDYTLPFDVDKGTALKGIWRDTAIVPPYGYLVIKQCYDAGVRPSLGEDVSTFAGKFVFHCHFLVHEDTGLIRNIILSSNASTAPTSGSSTISPGRLLMASVALAASFIFVL